MYDLGLRRAALPVIALALALTACDAKAHHASTGAFDGRWEFDMTFTGEAMCAFEGLPLVAMFRRGHADGVYTEPNYGG